MFVILSITLSSRLQWWDYICFFDASYEPSIECLNLDSMLDDDVNYSKCEPLLSMRMKQQTQIQLVFRMNLCSRRTEETEEFIRTIMVKFRCR